MSKVSLHVQVENESNFYSVEEIRDWVGETLRRMQGPHGPADVTVSLVPFPTFQALKSQVEHAYSAIDYAEFCRRAGFIQDKYSDQKWRMWQALIQGLASFDHSTLERIVTGNA